MGSRSIAEQVDLELNSTMWVASMTKLQTCMACIIGVEKGIFTLDTNVRDVIPELKEVEIITGFEAGSFPRKPITKPCDSPITLRQLISHSSGMQYDQGNDDLKEWSSYYGVKDNTFTGTMKGYQKPLVYEPGKGWAYSPGMDWAGRLIEVASGISLEQFFKENIWDKLGMKDTTFNPDQRPDMQARKMEMANRNRKTMEITKGLVPLEIQYPYAPDNCGGMGLYSTIEDCTKVLQAIMSKNPALMAEASYEALTAPQLPDNKYFLEVLHGAGAGHLGATWDKGANGSFGFGSSITANDFEGRRKKGSCNWAGMPGLHCVRSHHYSVMW